MGRCKCLLWRDARFNLGACALCCAGEIILVVNGRRAPLFPLRLPTDFINMRVHGVLGET